MYFSNVIHEENYNNFINKANVKPTDDYRKALFYLLAWNNDTSRNIENLYDFKEDCIEFEGLDKPWQTSTSIRVSRFAFNLYNNFCEGEEYKYRLYTPEDLLYVFRGDFEVVKQALELRYPS